MPDIVGGLCPIADTVIAILGGVVFVAGMAVGWLARMGVE